MQTIEGVVEKPRYALAERPVDGVQTTLDPYRAVQEFERYVTDLDGRLQERTGIALEAAAIHGSPVTGMTLAPDAIYNRIREDDRAAGSDMDLILLVDDDLDDCDLATVSGEAYRSGTDGTGISRIPVNPKVFRRTEFLETIRTPLDDTTAAENLVGTELDLYWAGSRSSLGHGSSYLAFLRSLTTGIIHHPDITDEEVHDALAAATDRITDDAGRPLPGITEQFATGGKRYAVRIRELRANHALGRAVRRTESGIGDAASWDGETPGVQTRIQEY